MTRQRFEPFVLLLAGMPAAGKLTIAQKLAARFSTDAPEIVDNHTWAKPIHRICRTDGRPLTDEVLRLIAQMRAVVLEAVRSHAPMDRSFVFTSCPVEGSDADLMAFEEIEDIAAERGAHFVPVRLTCRLDILKRRCRGADRRAAGKITDPDFLEEVVSRRELMRLPHPAPLEIDVSELHPESVVDTIIAHIEELCRADRQMRDDVPPLKKAVVVPLGGA